MSTTPYYDPTPYLTPDPTVDTSNVPAPLGGALNTFMADTAGLAYRAATGKVDPWTRAELVDEATSNYIRAGMDPSVAQGQAAQDISSAADSSNVTYGQAASGMFSSLFTGGDPNQPCGITNVGACVPTWVPWAVAGVVVLLVLYVLAPYVGLADDLAKK